MIIFPLSFLSLCCSAWVYAFVFLHSKSATTAFFWCCYVASQAATSSYSHKWMAWSGDMQSCSMDVETSWATVNPSSTKSSRRLGATCPVSRYFLFSLCHSIAKIMQTQRCQIIETVLYKTDERWMGKPQYAQRNYENTIRISF